MLATDRVPSQSAGGVKLVCLAVPSNLVNGTKNNNLIEPLVFVKHRTITLLNLKINHFNFDCGESVIDLFIEFVFYVATKKIRSFIL